MGKRIHERRTDHASTDDVIEMEQQLWEFAKRPDPPAVLEAKLRPGAFLYRVHRTWHSLGRGSGIVSHSFRALRDELLKRDPPVRNLQPKLYGTSPMSQADAGSLIDVMLETWHVARGKNTGWEATVLPHLAEAQGQPADAQDLDAIRENLLHTLFKSEETLLLEEPVGVAPEIFFEERGQTSLALITPTKSETTAHFSPSNAYGGFSSLLDRFLGPAIERHRSNRSAPLLIWILKLGVVRDNSEFHQAFHSLATYSACLTNWYFRLGQKRGPDKDRAQIEWQTIVKNSSFVVHGLPKWATKHLCRNDSMRKNIDHDLMELDTSFFVPDILPIALNNHRQVRRHRHQSFSLGVSVEPNSEDDEQSLNGKLRYWLFPDRPKEDLEETAETTGLPVFEAEISPGRDFDLAYKAIYEAVGHHLGHLKDDHARLSYETLEKMGWKVLRIEEFQQCMLVTKDLPNNSQD